MDRDSRMAMNLIVGLFLLAAGSLMALLVVVGAPLARRHPDVVLLAIFAVGAAVCLGFGLRCFIEGVRLTRSRYVHRGPLSRWGI